MIDYAYPTNISINALLTNKYAIKSGSTKTDNWVIGYNKNAVTSVWVGYDDNTNLDLSDYNYSRNIWVDAIEGYLKGKEDNWYKQPNNVVGVLVNPLTGKPATAEDKVKRVMFYIKGTEPNADDPVFDELLNN